MVNSRVHHFALALDDPSDGIALFAGTLQQGLGFLELLIGNYQQHSQPHIECAQHFLLRHVAQILHMLKNRLDRP